MPALIQDLDFHINSDVIKTNYEKHRNHLS
jgi:hypothetical protein